MPPARPRPSIELAVDLLGVSVRLRCDDPELGELLEACHSRSSVERGGSPAGPPADPGPEPVNAAVEATREGFRVRVDGRGEQTATDALEAVGALNHELLHAVMLRAPELYYVHAAVVVHEGAGIVLAGESQAGKSTLTLAFVAAGAGFLSDELLAFDPRTGRARAFPRAIKIRDECVRYFPDLEGEFVGSGERRFLPFGSFAADPVLASVAIDAIVLPRWGGEGSATELAPLTSGRALLALAESSLNFGTHRTRSLDCLAKLVRGKPAYALLWSDPHEAVRRVSRALVGGGA